MLGMELRTALVTGGSGGIGSEIVRLLRADGLHVIAVSPETDKLAALAAETGAECVEMDICDAEAVGATFGGREIDILVNCAALLGAYTKLHETTPEEATRLVSVNILGIVNCLRAMVPGMTARRRGHIVNFGSTAGHYPFLGEPLYAATKAAVHIMSKDLRLDLAGTGIRVSEILPGRVASGMHAELTGGDRGEAQRRFYDGFACLEPIDVARTVHHILSAPAHVDITHVEIMPTHQAFGGAVFHRDE
jgi:NADP-dependent 3-hydroxy acid dehydrogenase YdfG